MSFRIGRRRFVMSFPMVCLMTAAVLLDTTQSVILCFTAALMHELGHLAALRYYGSVPTEIRLTLFDVAITDTDKHIRSTKAQLIIVLAGVTVNFVSAAVCLLLYRLTDQELLWLFFTAHLTLGLFNSLPIESLDGGEALMLLLEHRFSPRTAQCLLTVLSLLLLLPLACAGFWLLLLCPCNFSLLLSSLYLLTALKRHGSSR